MQYITYFRVSTRKQDLGIDAQKAMVQSFLKPEDVVIASYEEKETGTNKKIREKLKKALQHCQDTGSVLLIAKLDRLARNVAFISNLMESGVEFKALDLPEANKLTIHIFAAMAEHEASLISDRTKAALAVKKSQGVKLGKLENLTDEGRKKGAEAMRIKKELNENNRRAKSFCKLLREKGHTLQQIADELNNNGFKTARSKQFKAMQVSRLL